MGQSSVLSTEHSVSQGTVVEMKGRQETTGMLSNHRVGRGQGGRGRGSVPHQTRPVKPIEALVVLSGIEEEEGQCNEEL